MYEYQKFYDRHKAWERIARVSLEKYFIDREIREHQLLVLDANARYDEFLKEFADCHERLTNRDIASYLRITPEAFSRLLNKKDLIIDCEESNKTSQLSILSFE